MTRAEKQARLTEAKEDLDLARQAMRDIANGKKQSYGLGTRNAAAYAMSLPDLRAWIASLEKEIAEVEGDRMAPKRAAPQRLPFLVICVGPPAPHPGREGCRRL